MYPHEHDYGPEVVLKTEKVILKTEREGGSRICRVCLQEGDIPIHGNDRLADISQELNTLAGINVREDDGFPKHLCESCNSQLQGAIQLRTTAQYSEIYLQQQSQRKTEQGNNEDESFQDADNKISGFYGHQNADKPNAMKIILDSNVRNNIRETRTNWNTLWVKIEPEERDNNTVSHCNYNNGKISACVTSQNPQIVKKKHTIITFDEQEYKKKPSIIENETATNSIIIKNKSDTNNDVKDTKPKTCVLRSNRSRLQRNPQNTLTTKSNIASIAKLNMIPKLITTKKLPTKKFYCRRCDICFDTAKEFRKHKETKKHKNPNVECPICHKIFSCWTSLKVHQVVHTQEKNHICDICGKGFGLKSTLDHHIATHSLNLPFHCSHCPYRGRNKNYLRRHMLTHTGEKPHQCDECEKKFSTRSNLKAHKMMNHKSGHNYNCDTCSRGFHYKTEVEKHIRADHMGIKDHVCDLCGKAFGLRKRLTKHKSKVHKTEKLTWKRRPLYLIAEEQEIGAVQE